MIKCNNDFLQKYFNIDILSKTFIKKKKVNGYYKETLMRNQKRTRSDAKIFPLQMILYLNVPANILWE